MTMPLACPTPVCAALGASRGMPVTTVPACPRASDALCSPVCYALLHVTQEHSYDAVGHGGASGLLAQSARGKGCPCHLLSASGRISDRAIKSRQGPSSGAGKPSACSKIGGATKA